MARLFIRDDAGNYWRAYFFIEKARTYDALQSPEQAFQAAKAFGHFQQTAGGLARAPAA